MSETTGSDTADSAVPDVIAIALIEDNRLVLEALTSMLNRSSDIRVVAGESSGRGSILRDVDAHVVLLDAGLENGDSLRIARSVLRDSPDARVIVMDLLPAQEEVTEFVSAGVSGFIMKDATLEAVKSTIRSVAAGNKVLPDQITGTLFSEFAKETVSSGGSVDHESVRLTPREREVINLIAEGLSNKAIAKQLHISVHTVKSHVRNIMEKLTLHSRLEIAAYVYGGDATQPIPPSRPES